MMTHFWPPAVYAAYCYRPSSVVYLLVCLVTVVSSAKAAEPIKIPFRVLSRVDPWIPWNHVLDGGADAGTGRNTFRGMYGPLPTIRFWGLGKRVSCAKRVRPILTIYTSYDVFLCKEVSFGGRDETAPYLRI